MMKLYKAEKEREDVQQLYEASFPEKERRDLRELYEDPTGVGNVLIIDEDGFAGFFCTLHLRDQLHIIYFAVDEKRRSQGIGAGAIQQLIQQYPECRIVVDLEEEKEDAENLHQRQIRKRFYQRLGFRDTGVTYAWQGEDYRIFSLNGPVTSQEFWHFWDEVLTLNKNLLY